LCAATCCSRPSTTVGTMALTSTCTVNTQCGHHSHHQHTVLQVGSSHQLVGGLVVWLAGHAHLFCLNLKQCITKSI
jgi:hypothetical protein